MKVIDCNKCFIIGETGSFIVMEEWINSIEFQSEKSEDDSITIDGITFIETDSHLGDYLTYIKEKFIQIVISPYIDETSNS